MQNWQLQLQQKIHNLKVRQARHKSNKTSNRHSLLFCQRNTTTNHNKQQSTSQLYDKLKKYGLQQYTRILQERGYDADSSKKLAQTLKCALTSHEDTSQIRLLPGHHAKMLKFAESLEGESSTNRFPQIKMTRSFLPDIIFKDSSNRSAEKAQQQLTNASPKKYPGSVRKVNKKAQYRKILPSLMKVITSQLVNKFEDVDLNLQAYRNSFRSMEGARVSSTMLNIDVTELVGCMAGYLHSIVQLENATSADLKGISNIAKHSSEQNKFFAGLNKTRDSLFGDEGQDLDERYIFKEQNPVIPSKAVLTTFIANILVTGRMERQTLITTIVYLTRFLDNKTSVPRIRFSNLTYRRLLITAMLLASKIWDDESMETHNLARKLVNYPTSLLNETERVFLLRIGYKLTVESGEYAEAYFKMRTNLDNEQKRHAAQYLSVKQVLDIERAGGKKIARKQKVKRNSF